MLYLNALQSTSCLPLHLSGGIHLKINGLTFHILNVGFISSGCDIKIYRKSKMLTAIIFKIHVYYANDAFKQKLLHKTFIAFFKLLFLCFPYISDHARYCRQTLKRGKGENANGRIPFYMYVCMREWGYNSCMYMYLFICQCRTCCGMLSIKRMIIQQKIKFIKIYWY